MAPKKKVRESARAGSKSSPKKSKSPKSPKRKAKSKSPKRTPAKKTPTPFFSPTGIDVKSDPVSALLKPMSSLKVTKFETLPVVSPGRDHCMQKYHEEKLLGQGTFGRVSAVCKNGAACNYALKASKQVSEIAREAYFLEFLENWYLHGRRIAPMMEDAWECPLPIKGAKRGSKENYGFLVMDRWDADLEKMAKNRAADLKLQTEFTFFDADEGKESTYEIQYYTPEEVVTMFQLAIVLGKAGVIHGDLKPDQYLERKMGAEICVSDFGLSGGPRTKYQATMGWSRDLIDRKWGCGEAFTLFVGKEAESIDFPVYFNVLQLEMYLVFYEARILHKNTSSAFAGLKNFDRTQFPKYCGLYEKERSNLKNVKESQSMFLDYQNIINNI